MNGEIEKHNLILRKLLKKQKKEDNNDEII